MAMTQPQYAAALAALLPPGRALAAPAGSTLSALLAALAAEFARVDARADTLLSEVYPNTTVQLLADWERVCALPDECESDPGALTIPQRQGAVVARLTSNHTPTVAYLESVAEALGYDATITELSPRRCGSDCGGASWSADFAFAFSVAITGLSLVAYKRCGAACGLPLATFNAADLLCKLGHLKPAHTEIFMEAA